MKMTTHGCGKSLASGFFLLLLIGVLMIKPTNAQLSPQPGSSPLSADQIPAAGTFWLEYSQSGMMMPPFPCVPPGYAGAPVYSLGNGQYLMDNSSFVSSAAFGGGRMMAMDNDSGPSLPPTTTNSPPGTNYGVALNPPIPTGILAASGSEYLIVDTLPADPDPTQVFPSWATMRLNGLAITTNGLDDTNVVASDNDGFPAGSITGVSISGTVSNAFVITRGAFQVLLTNSSGELMNTKFEVKIMRNSDDFNKIFHQPMMNAEYTTNSTNISLTPVSGDTTGVLYTLGVQFPPCVIAASRIVSIRSEPIDFDMPYAQLQWLVGNSGTNSFATWTADQTATNLLLQTNVVAMQLWGLPVAAVGVGAVNSLSANTMALATIPGTVFTTYTNFPDAASVSDFLLPDEHGYGSADTSQSPSGFYGARLDGDN